MTQTAAPTDVQLVRAVIDQSAGWDQAWAELMRRCEPVLRQVCRRFSEEDPEFLWDLRQELYLHLERDQWRRLRCYQERPGARFGSWLSTVASNLVLSQRRRPRLRTESLEARAEAEDRALIEVVSDKLPGPAEVYVRHEAAAQVQESMARLRHRRCQEILRRRYYQDESFNQIAESMRLKPATVRQMHHRNKQELGDLLRQRGFGMES